MEFWPSHGDKIRRSEAGLYLTGGGTWPGGYVTGIPGFNAARTILGDIRNKHH